MSLLSRIARSRGFGVHSPFAFRFITEVLADTYDYYAYEDLASIASGRVLKRARLLHRIAAWADGRGLKAMGIVGSTELADYEAVKMASDRMRLVEGDATLPVVIVTDSAEAAKLTAEMKSGMTFDNGTMTIIVNDPKLPLQHFSLRF